MIFFFLKKTRSYSPLSTTVDSGETLNIPRRRRRPLPEHTTASTSGKGGYTLEPRQCPSLLKEAASRSHDGVKCEAKKSPAKPRSTTVKEVARSNSGRLQYTELATGLKLDDTGRFEAPFVGLTLGGDGAEALEAFDL